MSPSHTLFALRATTYSIDACFTVHFCLPCVLLMTCALLSRECSAFQRAGQSRLVKLGGTDRDVNILEPALHARLHEPLPIGFLAAAPLSAAELPRDVPRSLRQQQSRIALQEHMALELARLTNCLTSTYV